MMKVVVLGLRVLLSTVQGLVVQGPAPVSRVCNLAWSFWGLRSDYRL